MSGARLTCDEVRELAAPFVLGSLEAEEEAAVREHLRSCVEAHEEYAELGSVAAALPLAVEPVEPPESLKARILEAAAADRREVSADDRDVPPATLVPLAPVPRGLVSGAAPRRQAPVLAWAVRAAAVVAIVALAGWNLMLQGELSAEEAYSRDVAAVLDVAAHPGAVAAVLAPAEAGGPLGLAAIGPDGRMALAMRDLVPTSGDQVYEAWVIVGDAAPRPLGGFTVGGSGTGALAGRGLPADPGVALAITLEPGPGATTPTLPILALGAAAAPPGSEAAALLATVTP